MDIREFRLQTDGIRHPWEQARFKVVHALFRRYVKNPPVVLDVGCGDGYVSGELGRLYNNYSIIGVDTELDSSLLKELKKTYPEDNVRFFKTMDEIGSGMGSRKVSVVLLLDVLEHIEDERAFLNDVLSRSWLSDDVFFLVTVPAFQSLFGSHDRFLGHYRRYSNRQIRKVLKSMGLEIVSGGYFFSLLMPVRLIQVLKEKVFGTKGDVESKLVSWRGGKKKSVIIKHILYIDFLVSRFFGLFGIHLPGLSNYVICRKPVS